MQIKLLRVVQEREFQRVGGQQDIKVDVRIIAATNQDLPGLVADRKFRQDLFYRLHVFPIRLPPLRERIEDIPLIAEQIIARHAAAQKKHVRGLHSETIQIMMRYPWPGNIRELENALVRAITLAPSKVGMLGPEYLPSNLREAHAPISGAGLEDAAIETVDFSLEVASADELWDGLIEGTVRVRPLVLAQSDEVQQEIRARFNELLEQHREGAGFEVPVAVKVGSGRKP